MYQKEKFVISDLDSFKKQALGWSQSFAVQCFLDHNNYPNSKEKVIDGVLALGAEASFVYQDSSEKNGFDQLENWLAEKKDWAFGFLSYDLKNELENLTTSSADFHQFPKIHFFRPEIILFLEESAVHIHSKTQKPAAIFSEIKEMTFSPVSENREIQLQPNFSEQEYLEVIHSIKKHIAVGDIYEMNFCQSFSGENIELNPLQTFLELNKLSAAPFATYYRCENKYLLCGSPERFLKKEGQRLLSQPIKGTRPRRELKALDELEVEQLKNSNKDKSENVMIVDLVRNDLAKSCVPGSIKVEELFGIYTFKAVHQMISTVSGKLRPNVSALSALRQAFPMGSMTGAPKIRAMQLIDQYERNARGLYSGTVGYFSPEGDFDFNVVIRSILYEKDTQRMSFQVGGAIVADSVAEQEYEECLVKAQTMMQVLGLESFALNAD